jgi:hypothetical protein
MAANGHTNTVGTLPYTTPSTQIVILEMLARGQ